MMTLMTTTLMTLRWVCRAVCTAYPKDNMLYSIACRQRARLISLLLCAHGLTAGGGEACPQEGRCQACCRQACSCQEGRQEGGVQRRGVF